MTFRNLETPMEILCVLFYFVDSTKLHIETNLWHLGNTRHTKLQARLNSSFDMTLDYSKNLVD